MEIGRLDRISAFLALLFLTARGGFHMHQEEFYAEVYVKPDTAQESAPTEESAPTSDNAENKELAG